MLANTVDQQTDKVTSELKMAHQKTDERNQSLIKEMISAHQSELKTMRERVIEL